MYNNIYNLKKLIMLFKFNIFTLTFSFFLYLFSFLSYSQNLYWAGFAFIGNKDQSFRYPIATDIFEQDNSILSGTLRQTLSSIKRTDVNFIFETGKISKGDAISVAFGLSDESLERIIGSYGVTTNYTIYGQVLVFDFVEKKVLANYPVIATSTFTAKDMPSPDEDKKRFETMYLNINDDASIFSQWAKMFEKTKVKESTKMATMGVRDIILSEKTLESMPKSLKKNGVFKSRTAQELEASIASIHNVPLIPYTIGEALGGKGSAGLATRFEDNVSIELKLPEKDFVFDILIRGFKKNETESDVQVQHLWGAYINVKLLGYEDSVIFSHNFRKIEEAIFSKSSEIKVLDNWIVYEVVLSNLIFDVMEQVKLKNEDGMKKLVKKDSDINVIKEGFKKIEEKFAQCI